MSIDTAYRCALWPFEPHRVERQAAGANRSRGAHSDWPAPRPVVGPDRTITCHTCVGSLQIDLRVLSAPATVQRMSGGCCCEIPVFLVAVASGLLSVLLTVVTFAQKVRTSWSHRPVSPYCEGLRAACPVGTRLTVIECLGIGLCRHTSTSPYVIAVLEWVVFLLFMLAVPGSMFTGRRAIFSEAKLSL